MNLTSFNQPSVFKTDFASSISICSIEIPNFTVVVFARIVGRAYLSYDVSRSRFSISVNVAFHFG